MAKQPWTVRYNVTEMSEPVAWKVKLVITRGLPGSGKSTWARHVVADTRGQFVRVNRDDIRANVFGANAKTRFDHRTEQAVTAAQQATVRALLGAGRSVIVDDTNLVLKFARAWADLAVEMGIAFEVRDFAIPLDVAISWDSRRPDGVGADVIRAAYDRFVRAWGNRWPSVTPTEAVAPAVRPYVRPTPGALPTAWLVDIDGTLALMEPGGRGPYDWHRVGEDQPNEPVILLADALAFSGFYVVLMSGRDAVCREATEEWLVKHHVPYEALFMRPEGDTRKDSTVKDELFEKHVRDRYDVVGVIDDRDQVVRMWRAKGLTVAQVDEGNF